MFPISCFKTNKKVLNGIKFYVLIERTASGFINGAVS